MSTKTRRTCLKAGTAIGLSVLAYGRVARAAVKGGPNESRPTQQVTIKPGKPCTLRDAVWIHAGEAQEKSAIDAVFQQYRRLGTQQ